MALSLLPQSAFAAKKKVKLNKKTVTVNVGKTVKIKLQNNKKKVKWTVTSGKKNVKLSKKKKTEVTIKGKKAGKAKVQAKVGKKKYVCKVTVQKRMAPRHDGQLYRVSPWVLVWENGNYYLIAYTEGRLKHYRVDKMQNVHQLPDTTREGAGEYANFDVNTYMQQMFGMFNGPLKRVTLQCENRFAGAMIDRFGTAPILTPCADGEHFTMTAEIQVSPQFFGWVAGFGTGVVVSGPPEVRAEMKKTLDQLQELYR